MRRENWILVRTFAPSVGLFAGALLLLLPTMGSGEGGLWSGVGSALAWLSLACASLGLVSLMLNGFRLWQWERGSGPSCFICSGPLGRQRDGRRDRGGPYRRCLACGKANNHRHYS